MKSIQKEELNLEKLKLRNKNSILVYKVKLMI